ncbi:hypothetical protein P879_01780 [Paragonimus westermani]|uniref:Neurotransmitter-gated ion-channel transmembrane domain-containing protein n=1 Tax=Paragonimus westermani TaxID=34504 RepID=A0A8T0DN00_9TREM|nr:hypothetical protein P879_01780 [Paragonimus westermani]
MQFPPGSESLYCTDAYYGNHYPMTYPVRENVNPFYQVGEYNIPPGQYGSQMGPYGRFPEYANRPVPPNGRSRVCAFCPACAGLAAAAAVTGDTNDLDDPDPTDAASIDQQLPSTIPAQQQQQRVNDPAEDLAAVWEAAISGSTIRRKQIVSSNGTECRGQRLPSTDREECMSGLTTVRDRSMGPDLEAFLLECIHPKAGKKAISAANTQWKGSEPQQRQQQQQQGLPSSPFYQFSSPHCEEDADEASLERWPSTGQVDNKPEINAHNDEDEESSQSVPNDLWRSNSSGAIHTKVKRPSMAADPVLLKRVHTVKRDVSEVVRCLRFMQRQTENKEKTNKLINEWRAVGMVLDRLFFVSYLFALGISIIIYFPRSGGELDLDGGP